MTLPDHTAKLAAAMAAARTRFLALLANVELSKTGPELEVRSEAGSDTAQIFVYGVIGSYWDGLNAGAIAEVLRNLEDSVTKIELRIHSPGGSMWDGIAIMNLFSSNKRAVTVYVDGVAASAASIVAMAGDEIVMLPGSQMMIHDAWIYTVGNCDELRTEADWLDKQSQNGAEIYAERAGGDPDDWRTAMKAETWYTPKEAVAAGLATRVEGRATTDDEDTGAQDLLKWDLSMFAFPGRDSAPAPAAVSRGPKPPAAPADGSPQKEETVAFTDTELATLRTDLGLADDATEAEILAAVKARTQAPPAPGGATQIPEGMQLVDSEAWTTAQAQIAEGAEAREIQREAARNAIVDTAVRKGKFPNSRREHYLKMLKADPEGAAATIDDLAEGLVPLVELGGDDNTKVKSGLTPDVTDTAVSNLERDMGLPAGSLTGASA